MRIGLITGEYPPDQGGVGDFTHQLAKSMVELGHQVHVLTDQYPIPNPQPVVSAAEPSSASDLTVHRVMKEWGWGCWQHLLALADELNLEVLNVQYQAAAYGMHPAINFVPRRQDRSWR